MWQKFNVPNSFSLPKDEIILQVLILIHSWTLLFYINWDEGGYQKNKQLWNNNG